MPTDGNPRLSFRLDPDAVEMLDHYANQVGLSRSAYIRFLISLSPKIVTPQRVADIQPDSGVDFIASPMILLVDFTDIKRELLRQGTNLNQAVKTFHQITRSVHRRKDEDIPKLLLELRKSIDSVYGSYDEFIETFDAFVMNCFLLRGDGSVYSEKP